MRAVDKKRNGVNLDSLMDHPKHLDLQNVKKSYSVCPYCSVGCGVVVYSSGGKVIYTEGDPENPVSRGALCAKGAALYQVVNNPTRVLKPLYRASGQKEWQEVEWDWAINKIAKRVKDTRDQTFKEKSRSLVKERGSDGSINEVEKEYVVNRTDSIVSIGSAGMNGEECYLIQRLMRSWGIVYFDDKTRT